MDRLTLPEARVRIAANLGPNSLVDPAAIDWTQPAREAVTIAGLVQSTDNFDERAAITAVALALLAYAAHLDFEAGREAMRTAAIGEVDCEIGCAERNGMGMAVAFLGYAKKDIAEIR